ncbi:hypothetical protein OPW36_24255 [Vibrio europaeus]|uniref:Uncharacterized protein n=1 Tax=Vibrio europaeus TaxID=300876 RepID=A0AAE7AUH5_9VIBR|nr:hypothetical protein [Vibrio europaeus]MDC5807326.1 hypothetical protein [Vibrio europaeus]MDC5809921.1 hypothetical protein [Vibrio europaeus]MDC5827851.1 hypothetical protein [Vibrio europaeus]MDC5830695.1 hypothetical protein [Vibrio europaeus]MDC5837551.1 hypothetical protein [Vibrio europaeus]
MSILRIFLAVVAAIAAWVVTHMLVGELISWAAILFCPEEFGSGGVCYVDWWRDVVFISDVIGVGLSACATILAAVWTANSHRQRVSRVTYYIGMLLASGLVISTWLSWLAVSSWFSALVFGWLTVRYLDQRYAIQN